MTVIFCPDDDWCAASRLGGRIPFVRGRPLQNVQSVELGPYALIHCVCRPIGVGVPSRSGGDVVDCFPIEEGREGGALQPRRREGMGALAVSSAAPQARY